MQQQQGHLTIKWGFAESISLQVTLVKNNVHINVQALKNGQGYLSNGDISLQRYEQLVTSIQNILTVKLLQQANVAKHEIDIDLPTKQHRVQGAIINEEQKQRVLELLSGFLIEMSTDPNFHREEINHLSGNADRKTAFLILLCVLIPYLIFVYAVEFISKSC